VQVAQLHMDHSHLLAGYLTRSGARTPPPVHTATVLTGWQNTWCYSAQLMTRPGEMSSQEENSTRTLDAFGTSSNESRR